MSVIIRLQNLPWSANSLDIRNYFKGLSIPEGGVHIVGGEMGDAFIAFSTDEDARQAMMLGGGKIKEVQISLMLSSRSEMQKIIEAARQASMSNSLAQLLAPPAVSLAGLPQTQQPQPQQILGKDLRDSRLDKKDSGDMFHDSGSRRDRREKTRSRSRERNRKDRRDSHRDRDRDRRRRSRSRSRSRDRRRKRSRSRSRGRDSHNRDRERKDIKDERKEKEMIPGVASMEPAPNIPSLDILNPTWNVMRKGTLAQNAHLLTNFELLRNLASQKGPLIPGGPGSLLGNPLNPQESMDGKPGIDRFKNNEDNSMNPDFSNRGDFGNRNKGENVRGGNQRGFENFEDDNAYGGDGRFDRNRGSKFQNFDSGFPMRNGNEPMSNRFGNFGRPDNGFPSRGGPGSGRDRPTSPRGLLDFPVTLPQRDHRGQNRQDRFSNRDDKVDEFGRSIQLRNRKNASNEETFKEDNKFQGNQGGFSGFPNRFGGGQPGQRPPPLLRGRDSWPPGGRGGDFQERRGFRGNFDEPGRGGFRSKGRESFGKFHDDLDHQSKFHDKDCCVEIRNLNPKIAYWEVRRPFSNLKLIVKDIKFFDYTLKDKKCRIRFLNNENKRKAMQMCSKILVDNKQVQLLHIDDSDFDECVDVGVKKPELKFSDDEDDATVSPKDAYIQVKDLSLNVEESDIFKLFPNVKLEKILLEKSGDGKSKLAYLKFQKAIDAKVALGTPNRTIGDSVVFLTPLPHYVFNDLWNKSQSQKTAEEPDVIEVDVNNPIEEAPGDEDKSSTCILMKNLPLEANDRDICDFFSDVGLVPNKIHLMLDMAGQPSGDAFCEFSDSRQMERACTKNSAPLGKNIVSVCQVPRSEMLEALGVVQEGFNCNEEEPSEPGHTDGVERPNCIVSVENIPFRANAQDIINFFGWNFKLTENDIMRRYNDRGQPTGDAKIRFKTPEDALIAVKFNDYRNLKGRIIRVKLL